MTPWMHPIGWTLMHFVWQGAVLALAAALALRVCRRRSARARYAIGCAALAAMLAAPMLTLGLLAAPGTPATPGTPPPAASPSDAAVSNALRTWTDTGASATVAMRERLDRLVPFVVLGWMAGVAILAVRLAGGVWQVRRLQIRSLADRASRWQAVAERMAARVGLRVPIHVVESTHAAAPAALGWLRPVILLPAAALANLTPAQVEAILAHELMHLRRYDYLVNIAQTAAETLLFFHPAVWWVSAQIRIEREHCCDDVAVEMCGDPLDYAAALAELAAEGRGTTLAPAATGGSLVARVRRLLELPTGRGGRYPDWSGALALTIGVAAVSGVLYAASVGQDAAAPAVAPAVASDVDPMASPETFDWRTHGTERFEIYFYPALAPALPHIADAAERAYRRVSSELRYDLPFRVPLILFRTRAEFEQQRIVPEAGPAIARGDVTSFSEPRRNRIVMLVEDEPERVYRQIAHELTHVFAFDIIPRERTNSGRVPSWIDEGLAEYMTAAWDPRALQQLRDLVAADRVPAITTLTEGADHDAVVAAAHLGHAAFEFMAAEYGQGTIWPFLLEVRRTVVEGEGNPYQRVFNRPPAQFDAAFARYLRQRFGA